MAAGCQEKESCSKVLNFLERLDDRIRQSTHEDTHMYTASVTLSSSPQLTSLTLSSSLQLTSLTLSSSLQVTSVTFLFSSANVIRSCSSHSCGVGHCDSGQSVGTYYLLTPLWHWSLCQRSVNWYLLPSHSTVALVTVTAAGVCLVHTGWLGGRSLDQPDVSEREVSHVQGF